MQKVLLDAGHGGSDSGAQAGGVLEKDIALRVVYAVGEYLGHLMPALIVRYTRTKDELVSLAARYADINAVRPDAFVSVHVNSIPDDPATPEDERKFADGWEIFFRDDNDFRLAEKIGALCELSGLWRKNRGIKQDFEWLGKHLTVLNNFPVPSILFEIGFLSNEKEREMIQNNIPAIAKLLAHGIIAHMKGRQLCQKTEG